MDRDGVNSLGLELISIEIYYTATKTDRQPQPVYRLVSSGLEFFPNFMFFPATGCPYEKSNIAR